MKFLEKDHDKYICPETLNQPLIFENQKNDIMTTLTISKIDAYMCHGAKCAAWVYETESNDNSVEKREGYGFCGKVHKTYF